MLMDYYLTGSRINIKRRSLSKVFGQSCSYFLDCSRLYNKIYCSNSFRRRFTYNEKI